MKPEYEAYLYELIETKRREYPNDPTDRQVLRARCSEFTKLFVEKFPHLKRVSGFYGEYDPEGVGLNEEHWWCVDTDGSIVDPTVKQFTYVQSIYTEYNEDLHQVRLGRCMNCGEDIFGKISEGHKCICSDECAAEFD